MAQSCPSRQYPTGSEIVLLFLHILNSEISQKPFHERFPAVTTKDGKLAPTIALLQNFISFPRNRSSTGRMTFFTPRTV
jgi:hypothetical protein